MTGFELLEHMQQCLGSEGARTYYPPGLCVRFLSSAQSLLILLPQYGLQARVALTIPAQGCFVDLRSVMPRVLKLQRVILGNVVTQEASRAYGQTRRLYPVSPEALMARRHWIASLGVPRWYWVHGTTILGVYPRPTMETVVTAIHTVMPAPFTLDTLSQECALQPSNHSMVSAMAAGLLLLREGAVEGQKGMQMLAKVLPGALLQGLMQTLGGLRQDAVNRSLSQQGSVVATA
jgi:hypothetical protein